MKYINDDINQGIAIDWDFVYKTIEKLDVIPKEIYYERIPFDKTAWAVLMSGRSVGKTTTLLIIGLVLYKLYGIKTIYLRERQEMIRAKEISGLYNVLNTHDIISKIFNDEYNNIVYKAGKWFLRYLDNGEIEKESEDYSTRNMSIDREGIYRSSISEPTADFIIFDEFISNYYMRGDFGDFINVVKTIKRDRLSTVIVMLSNTFNIESEYFDELEIRKYVESLDVGERELITTDLGTNIFIEFIENRHEQKKKVKEFSKYFGFKNNAVASITGTSWVFNNYPKITDLESYEVIQRGFFVKTLSKYYALDVILCKLGLAVFVHKSNEPLDGRFARIYVHAEQTDIREVCGLGDREIDKLIWKLYQNHRFYFANNSCGSAIENFVNNVS